MRRAAATLARHRDPKAGLAYGIPAGWHGPYTDDLVFLTSAVQSVPMSDGGRDPDSFGMVGAGKCEDTFYDPSRQGVGRAAMSTAIGFAEFFVPVPGKRDVLLDVAGENPAYVLGYVAGTDVELLRIVQAALADVRPA